MATGNLNTTVTNSTNYDEFLQNAIKGLISSSQTQANVGYTPYTGQRIAGLSDEENRAFNSLSSNFMNMLPQFQQANTIAGQAGVNLGNLSNFGNWNDAQAQTYMSPYINNVVNSTTNNALRTKDIALNKLRSQGAMAGSFGGSRQAIGERELASDTERNINDKVAELYNTGYTNAQNQFNADRNYGIATNEAYNSTAKNLAGLAGSTQAYQTGEASNLQNAGGIKRGIAQQNLDTAYTDFTNQRDYNKNQLNWLSNLVQGTNLGNASTGTTTTTNYQQPSDSSLGGIMSGLGIASNLFGGGSGGSSSSGLGSLFSSVGSLFGLAEGGIVPSVNEYAEGGGVKVNTGNTDWDTLLNQILQDTNMFNKNSKQVEVLPPIAEPIEVGYAPKVTPMQQYPDEAPPAVQGPSLSDTIMPTILTSPTSIDQPDIKIGDLFPAIEETWQDKVFKPNPLLLTGLKMMDTGNPYSEMARLGSAGSSALEQYQDLKNKQEDNVTNKGIAKANVLNSIYDRQLKDELKNAEIKAKLATADTENALNMAKAQKLVAEMSHKGFTEKEMQTILGNMNKLQSFILSAQDETSQRIAQAKLDSYLQSLGLGNAEQAIQDNGFSDTGLEVNPDDNE